MSTTVRRPFPVLFQTTGEQGRLEVVIDFQASVDDAAENGVMEVMTTFAKLGASGGLSGRHNPGEASMTLDARQSVPGGSSWVFREVNIDPTSLFVLLNMIHYVHLEEVPVSRVSIAWPAVRQLKDPMAIQFPDRWAPLSFRLSVGDLLDDVDVAVHFVEPQRNEVTERVVDTMSVWLLATHRGAYADDAFDPAKSGVFLGPNVMEVSQDHIIWFIEIMRCSESALDGLLNVLECVHQRVAKISHIEIGP